MIPALWLLAPFGTAHAACDNASLSAAIDRSEVAFAAMSEEIDALRAEVVQAIDCLREPIPRPLAGSVHRVHGLFAFLDGDEPSVSRYFARYRQLVPGATLPDAIAPREHPLRKAFTEASPSPGARPISAGGSGWVTVDGEQSEVAPAAMPWVYQHLLADGTVIATQLVPAGAVPPEPVPQEVRKPPKSAKPEKISTANPVDPPALPPEPRARTSSVRTGRLGTGLGVATLGVVLYGTAFATRTGYDAAVEDGDAKRIRNGHTATNSLTLLGVGATAAGGVLIATSFPLGGSK